MRYFTQSDVHGVLHVDCLWRYINQNNLIFEHTWNVNSKKWEESTELTGMIVHGESSLIEISRQQAMNHVPEAFLEEDGCHV